jgi:hypothetical protein
MILVPLFFDSKSVGLDSLFVDRTDFRLAVPEATAASRTAVIFRWLTGKSREPTRGERFARALDLNLSELAGMLVARLEKEPALDRAMLLVAFANIRAQLRTNRSVEESYATGLPTTYAGHGRMVASLFDDHPPRQRHHADAHAVHDIRFKRLHHFFRASVLGAVSERAHRERAELGTLAHVWGEYLASAGRISSLAQHSPIWSEDELEWFAGEPDEVGQARAALRTVVPGFLWRHDAMLQMARSRFGVVAGALKPHIHEAI